MADDQLSVRVSSELRAAIERTARAERRKPTAVIRNVLEDKFLVRGDSPRRKSKPKLEEHVAA